MLSRFSEKKACKAFFMPGHVLELRPDVLRNL